MKCQSNISGPYILFVINWLIEIGDMRAQVGANRGVLIKVHLSRLMLNNIIFTQRCNNSTLNQMKHKQTCQLNSLNGIPALDPFIPLSYLECIPLFIVWQSIIELYKTIKLNFFLKRACIPSYLSFLSIKIGCLGRMNFVRHCQDMPIYFCIKHMTYKHMK